MSAGLRAGYKQTEVGVIPEDWEVSRVGDVCGCIVPGRNKPKLFDGDIPWITTPDLVHGTPVTTSRLGLCISRAEAKSVGSKVVPDGSVLMSCAGELGIVALTQNEIVVNQQLHVFLPTERMLGMFLLNALSYRKDQIAGLGTKTAVPYLNKNSCNSILVPMPPPSEQRAIAAALSDVDVLLGGLDRLIAKKQGLKVAAMQQLLTGQTRLPGFSGEWDERTLNEVCWFQEGPGVRSTQFTMSGIKLLNGTNIFRGELNLDTTTRFISEAEAYGPYAHFMAEEGNIVLASSGITIDRLHEKVAFVRRENLPFCMNTSTIRFKPISGILSSEFLYHFLVSDRFKTQIGGVATGSAQLNFGPSHVSRVSLSVPGIPEQTTIAAILSDMDTELTALQARRSKTQALKHAMMQELLTGRIRLI